MWSDLNSEHVRRLASWKYVAADYCAHFCVYYVTAFFHFFLPPVY